jgi:uncharacterized membrane protein
LSNFANDYGDGVKGTDQNRIGEAEQRAVASGKISAKQMRNAMFLFAFLSLVATLVLLYKAFFPDFINEFYTFIGLGVACILAAIVYCQAIGPTAAARVVKNHIHNPPVEKTIPIEEALESLVKMLNGNPPPWIKRIIAREEGLSA